MPRRPPRPGLTSEPSEDLQAASGSILGNTSGSSSGHSNTPLPVTVDAENGTLVNNPALAGGLHDEHADARDDEDIDDERTSLLGKTQKLVSGGMLVLYDNPYHAVRFPRLHAIPCMLHTSISVRSISWRS